MSTRCNADIPKPTPLAASRTFLEQANAFKLLSGYESKIMRALEKHQAHLKALQAER